MVAYSVVETGPLAENCYLVWGEGKQAWIIDPGTDFALIEQEATARGLKPVCVVLTHGHFDHLGALDAVLRRWPGLPVVLRPEERKWAFTHPMNQYPPFYVHQHEPASLVEAGETWACGGIEARLIPTPGHTPGGQCILIEKDVPAPLCFTGDTIFQESIGRTDLPGGSYATLNESLKRLVAELAPETTLLPGHGPATTMAHERNANPYLQEDPGF